jgi:membrane protease YdiL (CAAX protease family)
MPLKTDQQPGGWIDRRPVVVLELVCGIATVAYFVLLMIGVSKWVVLALFFPTMLGYALGLVRYRRRRGGAPVLSKDPDDYR